MQKNTSSKYMPQGIFSLAQLTTGWENLLAPTKLGTT
jgi:hypothetical protein